MDHVPDIEQEDATILAVSAGTGASAADEVTHALVLAEGGAILQRVPVGLEPITVGRVPPCDLVLDHPSVSRFHCRVQLVSDRVVVTDLNSTNGTFVDGVRVVGSAPVLHGAVLRLGSRTLEYERRTQREIKEALATERDLQSASAYVQMLLPKPILTGPIRANWLFLPSAQLGGNAFGYRFLGPSTFAGYMLDVAGQGTGAAMHSVAVMNLLRQPAIPGVDLADPVSVLAGLNATFRPEDHGGVFFSIWYFVLDLESRRLRFASAGHDPAFLVPAGRRGSFVLAGEGPPIGIETSDHTFSEVVDAPSGSKLYLVSNGVSDAIERTCRPHGRRRLQDLIGEEPQSGGVPEPLRLYHALRDVVGQDGFEDDFSVVALDLS